MANVLRHGFVSAVPDGPDANLVRPSNWNAEHVFNGGVNGQALVFDDSQSDNIVWVPQGFANVKHPPYNAAGDDSTNDTAAIDAALGAESHVWIPPGTYRVDYLRPRSGQVIVGAGFGKSRIKARVSQTGAGIEFPGVSGNISEVVVQNLTIEDFLIGIDARGFYYLQVYNVHLGGNDTNLLLGTRQSGGAGTIWNTYRHVRFSDAITKDLNVFVSPGVDPQINLNQWEACQFETVSLTDPVDFNADGSAGNGMVGNGFYGCEFRYGLNIAKALATTITGPCYFEGGPYHIRLEEAITGMKIIGNYFNGAPGDGAFIILGINVGNSTISGVEASGNRFSWTDVSAAGRCYDGTGLNATGPGCKVGPDHRSTAGGALTYAHDPNGRIRLDDGDLNLPTGKIIHGKSAAGGLLKIATYVNDTNLELGDAGVSASRVLIKSAAFHIPISATGSLPSAGAANNGVIVIEDAGAGDRNLVIYAGGERFRIDGGAAF